MDTIVEQILKDRKEKGQCAVCGEQIAPKAEPYKDYATITHSVAGEVLVHKRHLK